MNGCQCRRLVEEHFPRFLERLDAEGVSLRHFVVEEFEAYLSAGASNTDSCV